MYDDKLMTVSDLAEYCQLKEKTIYRLARNGSLGCFRVGGAIRFSMEKHVEPYLNRDEKPDPYAEVKYKPRKNAITKFEHIIL